MPIRPALRWLYPIDWPQLSRWVRFERGGAAASTAGGRTARCSPAWPTDAGSTPRGAAGATAPVGLPSPVNLRGLCQRCHMLHDRPHHMAQRRLTQRMRWAIGDLFEGRYRRVR